MLEKTRNKLIEEIIISPLPGNAAGSPLKARAYLEIVLKINLFLEMNMDLKIVSCVQPVIVAYF